MKDRVTVLIMVILLVLSGCSLSLSDAVKVEGEAGQGAGGSGTKNIADLLKIPPAQEDKLGRWMPLPGGQPVFLGPVSYIITYMELKLTSTTKDIYEELNAGGEVEKLLKAAFTLFIIIYVISINLGIVKGSSYDIAINIIKFSLIALMSLNWAEFSFMIKDTLELGGKELTGIIAQAFSTGQTGNAPPGTPGISDFNFADDVVSVVLSMNMVKFIYALINPTTGAGPLFAIFMIFFIWNFVKALLHAVYMFVVAMIVRSLLLGLAPIFLAAAIFRATRPLFDGWIKQLINFTIMPVILFAFLGFFYELITVFIEMLGQTPVGQMPAPVSYDTSSKMPGDIFQFFMLIFGTPGNRVTGHDAQLPVGLFPVLALAIISYVMKQMVEWAIALSSALTQAFTSFAEPKFMPGDLGNQVMNTFRDPTPAPGGGTTPRAGAGDKG